jgi:glycosyl transferase family 28
MIGYYVHHQGKGHLHRAIAITRELGMRVTGLSSLPPPDEWDGEWVQLARDDDDPFEVDPDARGHLHWVPEHCAGLRSRTAAISDWIQRNDPELMVVDVSVEVALLARLHGVPVVTMVLPGVREDHPHQLVHGIARRVIAPWPVDVHGMLAGISEDDQRLAHVGGLSRFDGRPVRAKPQDDALRVTMMIGRGGNDADPAAIEHARAATPDWTWTVLGVDSWNEDPWEALMRADVVVAHAGQNSIAEIAAARRPAIIIPQERPFGEQEAMAVTLRRDGRFPVVALESFPTSGWPGLLELAARLDGDRWKLWNDGAGAARAAEVIKEELGT